MVSDIIWILIRRNIVKLDSLNDQGNLNIVYFANSKGIFFWCDLAFVVTFLKRLLNFRDTD